MVYVVSFRQVASTYGRLEEWNPEEPAAGLHSVDLPWLELCAKREEEYKSMPPQDRALIKTRASPSASGANVDDVATF